MGQLPTGLGLGLVLHLGLRHLVQRLALLDLVLHMRVDLVVDLVVDMVRVRVMTRDPQGLLLRRLGGRRTGPREAQRA